MRIIESCVNLFSRTNRNYSSLPDRLDARQSITQIMKAPPDQSGCSACVLGRCPGRLLSDGATSEPVVNYTIRMELTRGRTTHAAEYCVRLCLGHINDDAFASRMQSVLRSVAIATGGSDDAETMRV